VNGQPRHADKRRKIQPSSYDAGYGAAYSSTHTPHLYGHGSPTTVSANSSTASLLGTTAGTSLGSNPSLRENGSSTATNGTKRKRVTRASQAAAAAANTIDAFASYHPPPHPPIKAKDVYVQPVRDVSCSLFTSVVLKEPRRGWKTRLSPRELARSDCFTISQSSLWIRRLTTDCVIE
jgi:dual-specificity kinase